MSRIAVTDLSTLDLRGSASQRTKTREGFLEAPAMIATADNVQPYRASELGITDGDPQRIIRLYRPRSEVFSRATLDSFERCTLTVSHPANGVSAKDWKRVAAGDVHAVKAVGSQMAARLLVRDQDGIDTIEKDGVVQISCGYDFDLDMTPGTAADGTVYDGVQRNIVGNHVAIVDAARGGPALRIADQATPPHQQENRMRITVKDKKIGEVTIPGFSFTVADAESVAVQDAYDRHMDGLNQCYAAHDSMKKMCDMHKERADSAESKLAEATAGKKATDAALEDATKKLAELPALIETGAAIRASVVADAKVLVADFDDKGKTVPAIRTAVLTSILANDAELKGIVAAGLGGMTLDKAPEGVVSTLFATTASIAKKIRGSAEDQSANDAFVVDRNTALAGGDPTGGEGPTGGVTKAGKAPRFIGMDAAREADRLRHIGKYADADQVLAEAQQ